jgi:hypothetical protein
MAAGFGIAVSSPLGTRQRYSSMLSANKETPTSDISILDEEPYFTSASSATSTSTTVDH